MKEHLSDCQIFKIQAATYLLWKGQSLLEDVKNEVWDKTNYDANTEELEKVIDAIADIASETEEKYIPKKELKDYLSAEIVEMLSRDLTGIVEYDELKETFDLIQQVITNNIKDRRYLQSILNGIDRDKDTEQMDEWLLSKKFKELYFD
ncbi:TPA: hypothetical protein QCQ97_005268 [Bacillus cereus]|nr:hypothetical protein [Bacillus cereus]HDR4658138.1 hypothetical protein [Bacillus cereus]